jgi:hypothetical protein
MQPGWTYLFEAVYAGSTHVVQYPFEGLVLLDAVSPAGQALQRAEQRISLAETFGPGIIPVPEVTGAASELRAKLSEGTEADRHASHTKYPAARATTETAPSAPPTFEGWVVQGSDGSREQLIQHSFTWVERRAQQLLHPLAVWHAVCIEGCSRAELLQPWPQHMRSELGRMLDALEQGFHEAQMELLRHLAILTSAAEQQQAEAVSQPNAAPASTPAQGKGHDTCATESQQQVSEAAAAADALADLSLCGTGASTQAGSSMGTPSGKMPTSTMAGCLPTASAPERTTTATAGADTASEHGAPGSVSSWPAEQQATMQDAVHYMQDKQGAVQSLQMGMYYQRDPYSRSSMAHPAIKAAPRLRRLLLECIKPNKDGSGLPGYQPSANFQQTWAKGWAAGPQLGHAAEQPPPAINEVLPLVYDTLLNHLAAADVVRLGCTCGMWSQLVSSHPGYAALCAGAKKPAPRSSCGYASSWLSHSGGSYDEEDYGCDYEDYDFDDYGGYDNGYDSDDCNDYFRYH